MKREILTNRLLYGLIAVYLVFQSIGTLPPGVAFIAFFIPFIFVTIHSTKSFGWRDTWVVLAIMMIIGFAFEAIGTNTGFPFGRYYYPEVVNGPLLLGVPPLLPMVYAAMGYICYWIARLLLAHTGRLTPRDVLPVAGIAAMLMVLWDLSFDPTQSTVLHHYVWTDGGPYFGVPFENFTGWFLNTFVFFSLVGLYFSRSSQSRGVMPLARMTQPVIFYLAAIIGLAAPMLLHGDTAVIAQSMTLIAVFAMGVPGLCALAIAQRLRS